MTLRSRFFCLFLLAITPLLFTVLGSLPCQARTIANQVSEVRGAGVPQEMLDQVLALGVEHCLGPDHMTRVLDVLAAAAEEQMPVAPFVRKFEEGLAKQVPPPRIEAALAGKLDDYRFAQEAVVNIIRPRPGTFHPSDLTPLGESLDLGLPPGTLLDFLENAPDAPLSTLLVGVEALALLHQIGFDNSLATDFLYKGLRHKVLSEKWRSLPEAVVAARARSLSDSEICRIVGRVIDEEGSMEQVWEKLQADPNNVLP